MPSTAAQLRQNQRIWAEARGIPIDKSGYTISVHENLFQELSACSRREFEAGDGTELGGLGKRGKMQALHSSSALACNVFDFWRGRDKAELARALDLSSTICGIHFERKSPTGVGPRSPNLDVVLECVDGLVAVESKFCEPYSTCHGHALSEKYFGGSTGRWTAVGLSRCQKLAESLRRGEYLGEHLDLQQLAKHVLGLGCSGSNWLLLYLWFDAGEAVAARHRVELDEFAAVVNADQPGRFKALTYQELFARLRGGEVGTSEYLEYLQSRYGAAA